MKPPTTCASRLAEDLTLHLPRYVGKGAICCHGSIPKWAQENHLSHGVVAPLRIVRREAYAHRAYKVRSISAKPKGLVVVGN